MAKNRKHISRKEKEIMAVPRPDRRILSNVPDPQKIRVLADRRGTKGAERDALESDAAYVHRLRMLSLRYVANFEVLMYERGKEKTTSLKGQAVDISSTGILIALEEGSNINSTGEYIVKFEIPPGTMPEGFESKVKVSGRVVRSFSQVHEGHSKAMVALEFERDLSSYFKKRRWGFSVYTASSLLFIAVLIIMLMRVESIVYFKYNIVLYLYSLITAIFLLSRYFFGGMYRHVPINPEYTPGVSVIIPCFNEEQWIQRTILSCINQDYPLEQLEVIVVDDHSTDRSVEKINEIIGLLYQEAGRYDIKERLKFIPMDQNGGKREALVRGVSLAKHDLVVFVDSDSFLEPTAIKNLVQPFQDPQMGGVTGRTEVENKFTNMITKLQAVRYYIAFRIMKAAESYFDCVTCLSGPLSCYRKDLVLKHKDAWLNQKFLGHPATFGDDRSMTNFIMKTHRTTYQDTAICSTIVPSDINVFLKQQMRWKRSWLRESLRAGAFIWQKEPFMALFFYIGVIVPVAAPIVVGYNLIYVPLVYGIFPGTFLMGLLLMALLMSFAHLLFKKSKLWIFGFVFCIFYEAVLLWQMPVAWVTFWKSTWGTRETPQDVAEKKRKEKKRNKGIRLFFK